MSNELESMAEVNVNPQSWFTRSFNWAVAKVKVTNQSIEIRVSAERKYVVHRESIETIQKEQMFSVLARIKPALRVATKNGEAPGELFLIPWPFSKLESHLKQCGYHVRSEA